MCLARSRLLPKLHFDDCYIRERDGVITAVQYEKEYLDLVASIVVSKARFPLLARAGQCIEAATMYSLCSEAW